MLEKYDSLTAHVASVSTLALQNLVHPHVFVQVERANKDLVSLLCRFNIVAKASFQKCNRLLAIVLETSSLLFQLFLTVTAKNRASELHLGWTLRISQVRICLKLFDGLHTSG